MKIPVGTPTSQLSYSYDRLPLLVSVVIVPVWLLFAHVVTAYTTMTPFLRIPPYPYHHYEQPLRRTYSLLVVQLRAASTTSIPSDPENIKNDNIDNNSPNNTTNQNPWVGHDIYQRVLYRLSPGSDVQLHDAMIVEERCRFTVDPQRPDYIIPATGRPRTISLRNGLGLNFNAGEIGDDFFTTATPTAHNGAGNDSSLQSAIVCAMYLSANPDLCQGRMLQVSAGTGLGSLLGGIGAGHVVRHNSNKNNMANMDNNNETDEIMDDILTIGKDRTGPFPPNLELLSITDVDDDQLSNIRSQIKELGFKSNKLNLDVLDWRTRKVQSQMNRASSSPLEYRTIVASDIVYSYPETKELARAVAHRLEPITPYLFQSGPQSTTALPSFVHICPDDRDDVTYLRRILEKGYRMAVSTKFLKLEKLSFHLQKLPSGRPESELDNIDLELKDCQEIKYQALVAQHHPDYAGGGSGEWFFPMETGEYEATGGATFLEKEAGSSPW